MEESASHKMCLTQLQFKLLCIVIFLISLQKLCCGSSLEVAHGDASNEDPQPVFVPTT